MISKHINYRFYRIVVLALALMLFIPAISIAAVVTLKWDPNPESENVTGYKVYYGYSSRHDENYEFKINVGNQTTYTIPVLKSGQVYYFAVTAYIEGYESPFSDEIVYYVPQSTIDIDIDIDTDGDGLTDDDEINIYGTNPNDPDTDVDGINDGDEVEFWGYDWDMDFDNDGTINLLDPDSDNDGFSDGTEKAEGSDPGDPNSNPAFPLEIGEVSVDHNWKRVVLNDTFIDPVVVANPLSYNGSDPAVLRIRNVDSRGFDIRVQEWDYLDGGHATENVSYIVMERGSYILEDGTKVEAGTFNTDSTGSFRWVDFSQTFNQVPVVTSTVSSFNEEDAVCSRLRNIDTTGFEFRMQEQELNRQIHTIETISYIAWEPSSGTVGNLTFEVDKTDDVITHNLQTIVYNETFMATPVFLADMQTTDGGDTANLRWQNKDLYGIDINITEEQSRDSEIYHTTEVVGYMAFSVQ
ncbi:MAG: fibronectin type III domain-containing protein [Thermodesulfobacteriota bacterium]|nr:fibronectin type III domain-containing protein [Thermodesulfobacteriota bacterium]